MAYTLPRYVNWLDRIVERRNKVPDTLHVRAVTTGGYDQTIELMESPLQRIETLLTVADGLGPGIEVAITVTFNGGTGQNFVVNNNDGQLAQKISDWLDARIVEFREAQLGS